ncbi:transcription/translation regulatory transformer protein RfaH [Herbaspirillum huttiense]|uniref:transcription/translation regulatory transformer protein RfaH n=1 Tax=Herbaspirillum huttiense TaxID=863372 RepID=UPI0039AFB131
MHWHLVHTKPKQELCALENLQRQGYRGYLPTIKIEKVRHGKAVTVPEPLFPRYLFVQVNDNYFGTNCSPIRSTKGVSRLVTFGSAAAKVDDSLISQIRELEQSANTSTPTPFDTGEEVMIVNGPFGGLRGIFDIHDGERRVIVLIDLLSKTVRVNLPATSLRKVG